MEAEGGMGMEMDVEYRTQKDLPCHLFFLHGSMVNW